MVSDILVKALNLPEKIEIRSKISEKIKNSDISKIDTKSILYISADGLFFEIKENKNGKVISKTSVSGRFGLNREALVEQLNMDWNKTNLIKSLSKLGVDGIILYPDGQIKTLIDVEKRTWLKKMDKLYNKQDPENNLNEKYKDLLVAPNWESDKERLDKLENEFSDYIKTMNKKYLDEKYNHEIDEKYKDWNTSPKWKSDEELLDELENDFYDYIQEKDKLDLEEWIVEMDKKYNNHQELNLEIVDDCEEKGDQLMKENEQKIEVNEQIDITKKESNEIIVCHKKKGKVKTAIIAALCSVAVVAAGIVGILHYINFINEDEPVEPPIEQQVDPEPVLDPEPVVDPEPVEDKTLKSMHDLLCTKGIINESDSVLNVVNGNEQNIKYVFVDGEDENVEADILIKATVNDDSTIVNKAKVYGISEITEDYVEVYSIKEKKTKTETVDNVQFSKLTCVEDKYTLENDGDPITLTNVEEGKLIEEAKKIKKEKETELTK